MRFISEGQIIFNGVNKYFVDDFYMKATDVYFNAITLMITGSLTKKTGASPLVSVYIEASNILTFSDTALISGSRIWIKGQYGISFQG